MCSVPSVPRTQVWWRRFGIIPSTHRIVLSPSLSSIKRGLPSREFTCAISLIIYARRAETVGSSAIPGSLQPRSWIRRRASAAPAQTVRRPCSRRHVARQPADQKCNFAPAPAKPVSVAVPVPAPVAVPVPVPAKPVPVAVAVPVPVAVAVPVHLLNLSLNQ